MCPGEVSRDQEIPPVPTTDKQPDSSTYAKIDQDSARHAEPHQPAGDNNTQAHQNPYGPRYSDFLSNVQNFKIIESTLREGEQFANAFFDTETKIKIATALSDFGVEYIELTSPCASEQSRLDCEAICKLG